MDDTIPQLPRSLAAMERLERALQRLEQACEGKSGDLFAVPPPADDDKLARLESVAAQVEKRLDEVIGRLSRYLEV